MQKKEDYIWNLIARKFSGNATSEEVAALESLLLKNPDENYSMEILTDLWNSNPDQNWQYSENRYRELVLRMQQMGIDEERFTVKGEIIENNRKPGIKKYAKWILGITSFVIAGLVFFILLQKNAVSGNDATPQQESLVKHEIKTKYGSKTSMVLPDGTKVWLNAGSKMTYDDDYGTNIREVNLTGEAYFDVVKNARKPFIIHAGNINIRVLGTAFNVRCYPEEKNSETSLVRGSLEITMKDSKEKFILKPNEKLTVSNRMAIPGTDDRPSDKTNPGLSKSEIQFGHLSIVPGDNSIVETSWVNNKLVFRSETFEEVALKMERWYDVSIVIKDDKLKERRLTGVFEDETVEQALDAIQLTTPFSYKTAGEQIIISK